MLAVLAVLVLMITGSGATPLEFVGTALRFAVVLILLTVVVFVMLHAYYESFGGENV